ncbi:hypothetical protein FUA23_20725 [Neolewinella aurantiaca]|uniref:Uncharacterized protein n=1 Tax=Neolewinella aurantiaca TaxID=2602767 RepID=A0A5C7FGB1_9BACT|nr:hypothetical protein [Neolewinella aurantiaca]TXF85229.1 hypothetical protein FUA23_20725 [Neolewinella aurantiaca]
MSEIKSSGAKGYAFLGGVIAIFLFIILVVYLYKYNGNFVPETPLRYSDLLQAAGRTFAA